MGTRKVEPTIVCPRCGGSGRLAVSRTTVGDMILARRQAAGMTQQDLASKVGRSRAQIANIEGGRSDMPLQVLRAFADAFDCTMKDLIP